MASIENRYPKPCANCGHRSLHGEVSGCVHYENGAWCDCDTYVSPQAARKAAAAEGLAEGRRRAEEGANAALGSYAMTRTTDGEQWTANAQARMDELIQSGEPFTAEDVTAVVGVAPSPSAIGGLFRAKAFKDRAKPVGYTDATRPEAHGRPLRVWQGKA